jgi:TolA-binding protein
VQARAYSLIGDAYLEKKNAEDAISYYKKAAEYKPNKYFTPGYLMKLATAQEVAKDNKAALETYKNIVAEYPDAQEAVAAKKFKSKLEGILGE